LDDLEEDVPDRIRVAATELPALFVLPTLLVAVAENAKFAIRLQFPVGEFVRCRLVVAVIRRNTEEFGARRTDVPHRLDGVFDGERRMSGPDLAGHR
jgi:hypothetical protein